MARALALASLRTHHPDVSRTAVVAVIAAASLSVFATVVMPASADQIHGVEVGYTVLLKERT